MLWKEKLGMFGNIVDSTALWTSCESLIPSNSHILIFFIDIQKPKDKTNVQHNKIKIRIYSEIDMITKCTLNDMESKMGIGRVYVYAIEFSIFFCKAGPLWIKGGDEISGNRSLGDNRISYIYKKLNIINTIATIQSMAKLSRWRRLDHW